MQSGNFAMSSMKEAVNKMAYENVSKGQKRDIVVESAASQRTETAAELLGFNNTAPWGPEEQKLLEQVLLTGLVELFSTFHVQVLFLTFI